MFTAAPFILYLLNAQGDVTGMTISEGKLVIAYTYVARDDGAWRAVFPYGMDYRVLSKTDIWDAAQEIYEDYSELFEAAKEILFG